jgi:hypothetical protein
MSASVHITLTRRGVEKYASETRSISDIEESADLMKASSLYIRMLHEGVWEYFADEDRPPLEAPNVLLPSIVDGLDDVPRRIQIQVGNGPRDPFVDPPQWFIDSLKKAFPDDSNWEASVDHPGGEGEAAVMVFQAEVPKAEHWLDHWGWVGVGCDEDGCGGKEVLISEPYAISLAQILELVPFFEKLGWTFRILGKSAHCPSATLRIEIHPK